MLFVIYLKALCSMLIIFLQQGVKDKKPLLLLSNAGSSSLTGEVAKRSEKDDQNVRVDVSYRRTDKFQIYSTAKHAVDDNNRTRQGWCHFNCHEVLSIAFS